MELLIRPECFRKHRSHSGEKPHEKTQWRKEAIELPIRPVSGWRKNRSEVGVFQPGIHSGLTEVS